MIISAACGVCNKRLEWIQTGDKSWGAIQVDDGGCVSITIQDQTGVVNQHLATHHMDGTFVEAHKKLVKFQGERFLSMIERGLIEVDKK